MFKTITIDNIYFRDHLSEEFRNSHHPLPENIRYTRNAAIILSVFELGCCMGSFVFYDIDHSRIVLMALVGNIFFMAIGFHAKLTLSYCGLLSTAIYNISIMGGVYIYTLIDILLTSSIKDTHKGAMTNKQAMLLSSAPLFGLTLMGIYSCYLAMSVEDELEYREKNPYVEPEGSSILGDYQLEVLDIA